MITTEIRRTHRHRSDLPMPPDLRFNDRGDAAAVVMTFNGVEFRAVIDLDGGGMARPGEVAAMLEGLAGEIRKVRA